MEAENSEIDLADYEGFPCPESDRIEDGLALVITGLQSIRLGMDHIGATSVRLRRLARMRHQKQYHARAQRSAPPVTRGT